MHFLPGRISSLTLLVLMSPVLTITNNYVRVHVCILVHEQCNNELEQVLFRET